MPSLFVAAARTYLDQSSVKEDTGADCVKRPFPSRGGWTLRVITIADPEPDSHPDRS